MGQKYISVHSVNRAFREANRYARCPRQWNSTPKARFSNTRTIVAISTYLPDYRPCVFKKACVARCCWFLFVGLLGFRFQVVGFARLMAEHIRIFAVGQLDRLGTDFKLEVAAFSVG